MGFPCTHTLEMCDTASWESQCKRFLEQESIHLRRQCCTFPSRSHGISPLARLCTLEYKLVDRKACKDRLNLRRLAWQQACIPFRKQSRSRGVELPCNPSLEPSYILSPQRHDIPWKAHDHISLHLRTCSPFQ